MHPIPKYSVVIPVYNRPQEMQELLDSLANQVYTQFEVIIVEDGSKLDSKAVVEAFMDVLDIRYFAKDNTGPGDSRNFGMAQARGDYIILFDSDCVIPPEYFEIVTAHLQQHPLDLFGGPDDQHESFSDVQKAINFAMTSFITTGGIRGKEKQLDKFQPRSFNMGIRREVIEKVGGFSDIHPGEDPDLSYRIMAAGYTSGLIPQAKVWHKRRIDFKKFAQQVYKFGVVRVILGKWHPGTLKLVYFLPSLFLVGSVVLIVGSLFFGWLLIPLLVLNVVLFLEALIQTRNMHIALLGVLAALIQLYCYGWGFLKSQVLLPSRQDSERKIFSEFFFINKI